MKFLLFSLFKSYARYSGKVLNGNIELGGPAKVSMNDVAAILSTLTGKPVTVAEAPLEAMAPTLMGFGFPADLAELYREMAAGLISGHVAFEGGHRRVNGSTGVETVLRGLLRA